MATGVTLPKKTVKIENGEAVIMVNDTAAICPHVTRLLTPGTIAGQLTINGAICGSHCALFKIKEQTPDALNRPFNVETCKTFGAYEQYQEKPKETASIKTILNTGFREH